MFEWEGRILDNKSIQVVKAALPYLDIPVGNIIDVEGLLRSIRGYCHQREQKFIDMILHFFMMKRVMSMMSMMNEMNEASSAGHFQEYAPSEGSGDPGTGGESEWEGHEEPGAAYHGGDAEAELSQPFVFPAGGFGPFRNLDKGHESSGEAESGNDEAGSEE